MDKYAELEVRGLTGIGAEKAVAALTKGPLAPHRTPPRAAGPGEGAGSSTSPAGGGHHDVVTAASVVCVDIGSTYTKAALVRPRHAASCWPPRRRRPRWTTSSAGCWPPPRTSPTRRWSPAPSAGGGLRLAVVGYEELISAEAGHRAALSAGARVVHVAAGRLDAAGLPALADAAARRRAAGRRHRRRGRRRPAAQRARPGRVGPVRPGRARRQRRRAGRGRRACCGTAACR